MNEAHFVISPIIHPPPTPTSQPWEPFAVPQAHRTASCPPVFAHALSVWSACILPSLFSKPLLHSSVLVSGFPATGKPSWFLQAGSALMAPWPCMYASARHTGWVHCLSSLPPNCKRCEGKASIFYLYISKFSGMAPGTQFLKCFLN